jgi:SAM-dependent methyltransferase
MAASNSSHVTDPEVLRTAILARLPHRATGSGRFRWPAIPALLDEYLTTLAATFTGLGRGFDREELAELRASLDKELTAGFAASPYSKLIVAYRTEGPPSILLTYEVSHEVVTVADEYDAWLRTREPPLFGAYPDAKLLSLAHSLGRPQDVAILDVGAGTGRNSLPLAKADFAVDAVELVPSLAEVLRAELMQAGVSAQVFVGDALDPRLEVPRHKYQLIVLAEVVASHFRDATQLRALFERAQEWLAPDGLLLFSAFLAFGEYAPDALARQASQVFWCCLFTREEMDACSRGLQLVRVSDESAFDFEQMHLPDEAWPPTGWFEDWARGHDLFVLPSGQAPHELRWVVYRKTAAIAPSAHWFSTAVNQHIAAPRERVFAALLDSVRAPRIFGAVPPVPGIIKFEPIGASELVPGARRRVTWSDGSVTQEEVLELVPGLRIRYAWKNTLRGPLRLIARSAEADWTLASTPTGTVVYWTYRFEPRSRLTRRLMNIVLVGFRRWMRRSLQQLNALLK